MVGRARLRRVRRFRDPRSGSVRGLRSFRRTRAPAPWLVPERLCGQNPARESGGAHPAASRMGRHARTRAARWSWLSQVRIWCSCPYCGRELASLPQMCLTSDHASYPSRDLIRRWRKLRECLLEIDADSNLVIQRSRLLPCAGGQRMPAGKVEIGRNGRPTVDHVAETGNAVLLTAI